VSCEDCRGAHRGLLAVEGRRRVRLFLYSLFDGLQLQRHSSISWDRCHVHTCSHALDFSTVPASILNHQPKEIHYKKHFTKRNTLSGETGDSSASWQVCHLKCEIACKPRMQTTLGPQAFRGSRTTCWRDDAIGGSGNWLLLGARAGPPVLPHGNQFATVQRQPHAALCLSDAPKLQMP